MHKIKTVLIQHSYLLIAITCSGLYSILTFNKTFPLPEGWYTYYSQCINSGLRVYVDFEYLFFPLYIRLIAFITNYIGYKIIYLRILGIIVFILLTFVFFHIYKKIFTDFTAMVSSLVSVFFMQSEIVQIFYDYVRFMDLFTYISILFLLYAIENILQENTKKSYLYSILTAVFVSFYILTKQNMGFLFWFFIVFSWIFLYIFIRKQLIITNILIFISMSIFLTIFLLIFLVGKDNLFNMLNITISGASSSKGNLYSILFGWLLPGRRPTFFILIKNSFFPVLILYINYHLSKNNFKLFNAKINIFLSLSFGIIVFFGIILCFYVQPMANIFSNIYKINLWTIYFTCVLLFIFYVFLIIYNYFKNVYISLYIIQLYIVFGSVFTIGFGCGTSGGLAPGQLGFALGLIVALALSLSYNIFRYINIPIILLFSIACILSCASFKYLNPYNWWGFHQPSVYEATETTKIPNLSYIKVSKETKIYLETIYDIVKNNTNSSDSIFCFPHIPVLYSLCERNDPGTFTKVQWFDVSTDLNVINDINIIKKSKPKVIIINDLPKWAIMAHESAFRSGQLSGYSIMKEFLDHYVNNKENNYNYFKRIEINESYSIIIYVRNYKLSDNEKNYNFWADLVNKYDFSKKTSPDFLKMEYGLSKHEPWGPWSDANLSPTAIFIFKQDLPNSFLLHLKAKAFGPNKGKNLIVRIGGKDYSVFINDEDFECNILVDLDNVKTNKIEFISPAPTSPSDLWLDQSDKRKLGIGFKTLNTYNLSGTNSTVIDFKKNLLTELVERIEGLSVYESWGRWSDANLSPSAIFTFKQNLPNSFLLHLKAKAFGPNKGKNLIVKIGGKDYSAFINDENFECNILVDLDNVKTNKIEFISPAPTSPSDLWLDQSDKRKLGVGFNTLNIYNLSGTNSTVIDFRKNTLPESVESTEGLSVYETWGRWSGKNVAPSVVFKFKEDLPDKFYMYIDGVAYGPNVGENLLIKIGTQKLKIILPSPKFESKIFIDLNGDKANKIEFIPPKPTKPEGIEFINKDLAVRKLGIGFIKLIISNDERQIFDQIIDIKDEHEYLNKAQLYDKRYYLNGHTPIYNEQKAFELYMKAANMGNKIAQRSLVGLYRRGLGCDRSYYKAVKWFLISHGLSILHSY